MHHNLLELYNVRRDHRPKPKLIQSTQTKPFRNPIPESDEEFNQTNKILSESTEIVKCLRKLSIGDTEYIPRTSLQYPTSEASPRKVKSLDSMREARNIRCSKIPSPIVVRKPIVIPKLEIIPPEPEPVILQTKPRPCIKISRKPILPSTTKPKNKPHI